MKNKVITIYELIGLIKDNKAPKKVKYDGDVYVFAGEDYSKNDDRKTWLITKYDYFLTTFFNEEIEILPEENDELEDIEELKNYPYIVSQDDVINTINQLIKNQKYLKERLDKDDR